ncbi:MAG: type II toxin-antitoxin system death-on-curing family toxin [Caulobacter sp.]|nr:type II toxin-antitoxin system death-on-curing family toxin [Caulobacter sp.]
MPAEPSWLEPEALLVLHSRSLALHGGADGCRDLGLLDSALQRPRNRHAYEGVSDLADLAASYAVAICGNHPFVDGNKRSAFLALVLFLRLNGHRLVVDQVEAIRTIFALASGELGHADLTDWVRRHLRPA